MSRTIAVWILLGCTQAVAGVVNYDEAIGGDLPFGPQTPLFSLGVGTNTISGSMWESGVDGDFRRDTDSIRFTIPSGTRIESIFLTIDDIQLDNITKLQTIALFLCALCNIPIDQRVDLLDPPMEPLLWYAGDIDFPSGTPEFWIDMYSEYLGGTMPYYASWGYGISINVEPVPLPGAVWLFASAIMLLLRNLLGHPRRGFP